MSKEAMKLALRSIRELVLDESDDAPALQGARMRKQKAEKALLEALAEQCQCPNCKVTLHASDCAVHNEPAYPKGQCNCVAQPEQEPVLWAMPDGKTVDKWALQFYGGQVGKPLYTTPPQRKPLTDEQRDELARQADSYDWGYYDLIDAVEAAHGIKE